MTRSAFVVENGTAFVTDTTPEFRRYYRDLRAMFDRYEANLAAIVAARNLGGAVVTLGARTDVCAMPGDPDDMATLHAAGTAGHQ